MNKRQRVGGERMSDVMTREEYNLTKKERKLLNIGRKQGALEELKNIIKSIDKEWENIYFDIKTIVFIKQIIRDKIKELEAKE